MKLKKVRDKINKTIKLNGVLRELAMYLECVGKYLISLARNFSQNRDERIAREIISRNHLRVESYFSRCYYAKIYI